MSFGLYTRTPSARIVVFRVRRAARGPTGWVRAKIVDRVNSEEDDDRD